MHTGHHYQHHHYHHQFHDLQDGGVSHVKLVTSILQGFASSVRLLDIIIIFNIIFMNILI